MGGIGILEPGGGKGMADPSTGGGYGIVGTGGIFEGGIGGATDGTPGDKGTVDGGVGIVPPVDG